MLYFFLVDLPGKHRSLGLVVTNPGPLDSWLSHLCAKPMVTNQLLSEVILQVVMNHAEIIGILTNNNWG